MNYKDFEDHFRGPRELITQRLSEYAPLVTDLLAMYPDAMAIDLGCGRGEWLEVLGSLGFQARHINIVKAC